MSDIDVIGYKVKQSGINLSTLTLFIRSESRYKCLECPDVYAAIEPIYEEKELPEGATCYNCGEDIINHEY